MIKKLSSSPVWLLSAAIIIGLLVAIVTAVATRNTAVTLMMGGLASLVFVGCFYT